MSLQDWGALGELVGGFAIIVSLLYVGLQIKHGNREAKAATLQATMDSEMFLQAEALRYAGTWEKVLAGKHLEDGEETRRGILLYSMMMTLHQIQYDQFKTGYLDNPPDTQDAATFPIYEVWRASGGATRRSLEFLELLDRQHQRGTVQ